MTYNDKDWTTSFRDRLGCIENYTYETSKDDPKNHYWSLVKKICGKEVTNQAKFEFFHKVRPDGVTILYRTVTTHNNHTTDITYHERFGRPTSIRRDNENIDYDFDENGRFRIKSKKIGDQKFEYDKLTKEIKNVMGDYFSDYIYR